MEDAGSNPVGLPPRPPGGGPRVLAALRRDLPQWRKIRAEMPSPRVVEAAAAARRSGDWRTAATIAGGDVTIDLDAVRDRFGAEAAEQVEDDLRHLALDLLWCHL